MMFFGLLAFGFITATLFDSNLFILIAMGFYIFAKRGAFPIQ